MTDSKDKAPPKAGKDKAPPKAGKDKASPKAGKDKAQPSPSKPHKGRAFFERAEEVAATGNWDFAIEMYIEGIRREPGNVKRGHQPLREVSLKRKAQGGKGPGMLQQMKRRSGKDPVESLANAEYLLAKEPGSAQFMEQVLKAARAAEQHETIIWIANILLEAQRQAKKPSKRVLLVLTEAMADVEEYASAIAACEMARQLTPDDDKLHSLLQEMSAKYTIKKGKYDEEGDFTRSVKDLAGQKELAQSDALAQDTEYLLRQVERARKDYLETPEVQGKINALADALLKFEDASYENEAVDVLAKAHKDLGAYQYKMRIGDIKIRQMTRRYHKLAGDGDAAAAREHARKQLAFELDEYAGRVANYPTDLALKYELGRRQFLAGQLDEAIGSLQQAQRDPRRHVRAMNYLGQAFTKKGKDWYREAVDTYRRVLEAEISEERSKDLRYNLGCVLEKMNELEDAQDEFSRVAQIDYNYKDVRGRLEGIRKKLGGGQSEP